MAGYNGGKKLALTAYSIELSYGVTVSRVRLRGENKVDLLSVYSAPSSFLGSPYVI